MAHAGQIIDNPVSGERITFRKTAADTDGRLLEIDLELAPGGHVPGIHRPRPEAARASRGSPAPSRSGRRSSVCARAGMSAVADRPRPLG